MSGLTLTPRVTPGDHKTRQIDRVRDSLLEEQRVGHCYPEWPDIIYLLTILLILVDFTQAAGCGDGKSAEIQFILDSSDAVTLEQFNLVRQFYRDLIQQFDVGAGSVNVGVVRTSTNANMMIEAGKIPLKNELLSKLDQITYTPGFRFLHEGFKMLLDTSYRRERGARVLVLVLNSVPEELPSAITHSRKLRYGRVEIFVVGVGTAANSSAIYRFASEPFQTHFKHVNSFDHLQDIKQDLTSKICDSLQCGSGRHVVDGKCQDINECDLEKPCAGEANCRNGNGTFYCTCRENYKYSRLSPTGCEKYTICFDRSPNCPNLIEYFGSCTLENKMVRMCPVSCRVCSMRCPKFKTPDPNGRTCGLLNECEALPLSCPSGTTCIDQVQGYRCECGKGYYRLHGACIKVDKNFCIGYGDPHFITFDKASITFQGTCTYTIAEPCSATRGSLPDFKVYIKNENRNRNTKVSYIQHVIVHVQKYVVKLAKNREVFVDGVRTTLPSMPEPSISIRVSGENVVLKTAFGLTVSFDGDSIVKVEIADEYKNKMCGVCGNMDGDKSNDKVTKFGLKTHRGSDIGNSYKLVTESGECADAEEPIDKCAKKTKLDIESEKNCGILTKPNGPFATCHKKVDPKMTFDSCIYDMCYFNLNASTLCRALEGYADQCREKGVNLNWRSVVKQCPYDCHDNNTVFGSCTSACPRTCADVQGQTDAICHEACVEGCQCKQGYVLSDKQCVEESKCGCLFKNSYYLPGESWGDKICGEVYECNIDGFITTTKLSCKGNKHCEIRNGTRGCFCPVTHVETPTGDCKIKEIQNDELEPPPIGVPKPLTSPDLDQPVAPIDDGDPYFSTEKFILYKKRPHPLGIESGVIQDDAITASTETLKNEARKARPLSGSGWVPKRLDNKRWIKVDLGKPMDIHGLGTLGHSHYDYWVTKYTIYISVDGVKWEQLKQNNSDTVKQWEGNENNNVWRRHCFHRYYGHPIYARYVKIVVETYHLWIGLRIELYGYRDGNGAEMIAASLKDAWTLNVTGCSCYYSPSEKNCACCEPGGCQCPSSFRHQCVQCGYAGNCGTLDIKPRSIQVDPWTRTDTGCPCPWAPDRKDCACCQNFGCLCPERNQNQCHQCGRPQQCGQKEHVFGPNGYCIPKNCTNV